MVVVDDEGDDAVGEAFFEEDQPAYSAIAILKGMNGFKIDVEFQ